MKKFIMMSCGYVESNRTSWLIYQCNFFGDEGFDTAKEAVTELALDLYAKFHDEYLSVYQNRYSDSVKECCRKALIANHQAKFCSECGCQLLDEKFNPDEFMEYVTGLHDTTCDSYGDAEGTSTRSPLAWYPWWSHEFLGAKKKEIVFIPESAEHVILCALLEAKPELKEQADQCQYEIGESSGWEAIKEGRDIVV